MSRFGQSQLKSESRSELFLTAEDWNDWAARSAKSKPVSPHLVVMALGADTLSLLRTQ